jgi:hypothetical protein
LVLLRACLPSLAVLLSTARGGARDRVDDDARSASGALVGEAGGGHRVALVFARFHFVSFRWFRLIRFVRSFGFVWFRSFRSFRSFVRSFHSFRSFRFASLRSVFVFARTFSVNQMPYATR